MSAAAEPDSTGAAAAAAPPAARHAEAHVQNTWVPTDPSAGFGIANLPYGVFVRPGHVARIGVRVGDHVLDLASVLDDPVFAEPTLNAFMRAGRQRWSDVRAQVIELLSDARHRDRVAPALTAVDDVAMRLPFEVADYVDFYSSLHHATNVGRMFRPDAEPLLPNWRHLPVAYHGRAGTVVVSDTTIVRPCGQHRGSDGAHPAFGPSRRLDFEAEVGFVVGTPTRLGTAVAGDDIRDHVFGVVLVNDWSARDIQAWEYVPLGPNLGKSFATSISPWVVPLAALDDARVTPPEQDPAPLPYLRGDEHWGLDLTLQVRVNDTVVSHPPFAQMYWTPAQQLAHMTVNGAALRTGDLYASGTVSGPEPGQRGSLLELSWNGTEPLTLDDGSVRTFLEDGDTVTISATAPAAGGRISLGEVVGTILPAQGAAGEHGCG